MKEWRGMRYPVGTRVQHRNGYIVVKVVDDEGKSRMMAESRRCWELRKGPLEAGDRVFHIDGDRTNNDIRNLAMVHFNQTKFTFLKKSEILYMPTQKSSYALPTIRTIDKKTGRILVNS